MQPNDNFKALHDYIKSENSIAFKNGVLLGVAVVALLATVITLIYAAQISVISPAKAAPAPKHQTCKVEMRWGHSEPIIEYTGKLK